MVVKGTIQSGPLMEHTSYSGGDKGRPCDRNHVTRWMVGKQELIELLLEKWQSENHFSFCQE